MSAKLSYKALTTASALVQFSMIFATVLSGSPDLTVQQAFWASKYALEVSNRAVPAALDFLGAVLKLINQRGTILSYDNNAKQIIFKDCSGNVGYRILKGSLWEQWEVTPVKPVSCAFLHSI